MDQASVPRPDARTRLLDAARTEVRLRGCAATTVETLHCAAGWVPVENPFFTVLLDLAPDGKGTLHEARARHWSEEACRCHEEMGFHSGWNAADDPLEVLAKTL